MGKDKHTGGSINKLSPTDVSRASKPMGGDDGAQLSKVAYALLDQIAYYETLREHSSDLQTVREYEMVLEALRAVADKGGVRIPPRQVKDADVRTEG